jgi:hypothetical protein
VIVSRIDRVQIEQNNLCAEVRVYGEPSIWTARVGLTGAASGIGRAITTRFRAAHEAPLREIRVAPRRPSTQNLLPGLVA